MNAVSETKNIVKLLFKTFLEIKKFPAYCFLQDYYIGSARHLPANNFISD